MTAEASDRLLSGKDVAALLSVSERTVERLAFDGRLQKVLIGGSARYRQSDVAGIIVGGASPANPGHWRGREGSGPRRTLQFVRDNPSGVGPFGVRPSDVAKALGLSPAAARVYLHNLERRGLITRVGYGLYTPAADLESAS